MNFPKWLQPAYKKGDKVLMPTSKVNYEVANRWWWFGWHYDLQLNIFGCIHYGVEEAYLSPASHK